MEANSQSMSFSRPVLFDIILKKATVEHKEFNWEWGSGVDDTMTIIIWTHYFLLSQGCGIIENLLLQDNKSSILLEQNGRALSGKCTRYINIQYFFITDQVNMKEISIDWCPTKKMGVADFMTKPSQVSNFWNLRGYIIKVECDVLNPKLMWSVWVGRPARISSRRERSTASALSLCHSDWQQVPRQGYAP
jgi:hypothetical protein